VGTCEGFRKEGGVRGEKREERWNIFEDRKKSL
jgi:hypothetical protein